MKDLSKIPFAEWLEGFIEHVVDNDAQWIGVVVIDKDGKTSTGYTEDDNTYIQLATTAMSADMLMNIIALNRETILDILFPEEEMEAEP